MALVYLWADIADDIPSLCHHIFLNVTSDILALVNPPTVQAIRNVAGTHRSMHMLACNAFCDRHTRNVPGRCLDSIATVSLTALLAH